MTVPPTEFQAEDGIRDTMQSRGLGDVYKRQGLQTPLEMFKKIPPKFHDKTVHSNIPVSYTHLTLPTTAEV